MYIYIHTCLCVLACISADKVLTCLTCLTLYLTKNHFWWSLQLGIQPPIHDSLSLSHSYLFAVTETFMMMHMIPQNKLCRQGPSSPENHT